MQSPIKVYYMKYYTRVLLLFLCLNFLSCSGSSDDDNSSLLSVDIGSSSAILIPAPAATQSCEQESRGETTAGTVAGSYFTMPNPIIKWTEAANIATTNSEVSIVVLKFTLNSAQVSGEYSCIFSDTGLNNLYYKRTSLGQTVEVLTWDGKLGKNSAAQIISTTELKTAGLTPCALKCGGVTVPKGTGPFSVTGEWELLAVQRKYSSSGSYEEFPLKVTGTFTVENTLN